MIQETIRVTKMDRNEAIEILSSEVCACKKAKARRMAFCSGCYYKLSATIRRALYAPLGKGFEQAYDLSLETLGLNKDEISLQQRLEFARRHGE